MTCSELSFVKRSGFDDSFFDAAISYKQSISIDHSVNTWKSERLPCIFNSGLIPQSCRLIQSLGGGPSGPASGPAPKWAGKQAIERAGGRSER